MGANGKRVRAARLLLSLLTFDDAHCYVYFPGPSQNKQDKIGIDSQLQSLARSSSDSEDNKNVVENLEKIWKIAGVSEDEEKTTPTYY